jgi:hypothetical protein
MEMHIEHIRAEVDKAVSELQAACNLWLEEYNFSARVDEVGFWGYCPGNDTIEIQIYESPEEAALWDEFLYEHLHCPACCDIFITSFLHELGHAFTIEFFDEHDWDVARNASTTLEYFEAPIEIAATRWAIDFMVNEKEKVDALAELVEPIIEKIV